MADEDKNVGIFDTDIEVLDTDENLTAKKTERSFEGVDTFSFKMMFIENLNEQVYPYIREKKMMLYDRDNPIYQEYLDLFSEAEEIQKKAPSAELYKEMSNQYKRYLELVDKVVDAKKNDGPARNRK